MLIVKKRQLCLKYSCGYCKLIKQIFVSLPSGHLRNPPSVFLISTNSHARIRDFVELTLANFNSPLHIYDLFWFRVCRRSVMSFKFIFRWHAMESLKEIVRPTITPSACPMFQVLITRLHQLQELLAVSLFKQAWCLLATKLDQYLYEEMAAICVFNEGGTFQFNYDITKNLFPLFGQYSSKPEAHFKLWVCLLEDLRLHHFVIINY